jgi:hypothetical protein
MRSISSVSIPLSIPRSIPIPIQKSPTNSSFSDNTYILKQNSFDPTKSSPPNDFMLKLTSRLNSMK